MMLRSVRKVRPLVRSLLLGVTLAAVTVLATGTVVGCAGDDRDPQTHVDKLKDPIQRPAAVKRLLQMYEDKMTEDKKDREGKNVKPVLDVIVEPLGDMAQSGELDERTQGEVLSFLADSRHPKAIPALIKAIQDYRPDDKRASDYDTRIGDVVRNIGEMTKADTLKSKDMNEALLKLFTAMRASTPKAQNRAFFRVLNNTLLLIADPAWEDRLITLLKRPIQSAKQKHMKAITNEVYWQITAAEILGTLRSKKAVPALIKTILTPSKANIQTTAINALIKIGKPAIEAGVKLLNGEEPELAKYAEAEYIRAAEDRGQDVSKNKKLKAAAKNVALNSAVIIVANIGRQECVEPMLAVLKKGNKTTNALIGRELYKLPADPKITETFKRVYEETSVDQRIPPDVYAKEGLVESAGSFFDPHLAGWLAENALELEGDQYDVESVQMTVLGIALKASTPANWPSVTKLLAKLPEVKADPKKKWFIKNAKATKAGMAPEEGPFTEAQVIDKIIKLEFKQGTVREDKKGEEAKPITGVSIFQKALNNAAYHNAYNNAESVLNECGEKIDCYFKKLTSPEASKQATQMVGLKAAYMIGLLGGEGVKVKLVEALPRVDNAAIRFVITLIIDRKSPKGDKAIQAKLQAMIDKAAKSRDQAKIKKAKSLKQVIYRLEARSQ